MCGGGGGASTYLMGVRRASTALICVGSATALMGAGGLVQL